MAANDSSTESRLLRRAKVDNSISSKKIMTGMDENEIKMKMLSQISFIARNGERFSSMQQFRRRCLLYGFNKQLLFGIAAIFKDF